MLFVFCTFFCDLYFYDIDKARSQPSEWMRQGGYFVEIVGRWKFFGVQIFCDEAFWAKNGQKWAKKGQKGPKMAKNGKNQGFFDPFSSKTSQICARSVFFCFPPKPGFRTGGQNRLQSYLGFDKRSTPLFGVPGFTPKIWGPPGLNPVGHSAGRMRCPGDLLRSHWWLMTSQSFFWFL